MSTAHPDLPAAMIGWLRASPSVVTAFAENTNALATTKFWADAARPGVALPWAVYEERDGEVQSMTAARGMTCSIETGIVRFTIVAPAKKLARDLGRLVVKALDDAPLLFADGRLMYLRAQSASFQPVADIAPASPTAHARVIDFRFMVQRTA